MATIAELSVLLRADTRGFQRGLSQANQQAASLQRGFRALQAAGVVYVTKSLFDLGSRVEETGSKFRTVFGDSARALDGFAERFGTLAGLSREQSQAVLATTGSIVQGMGFAQDASAAFSRQVVTLAGDLSSFNNIPVEDTSRAIQAALTGEREQLKRLGIVLRETDVQQRALTNTGKTNVKALTDQERATATLQLITERAGAAVGDLARTQDSAANQARQLGANLQNVRETIAAALLPVMSFTVTKFLEMVKGMQILGAEAAVLIARFNFWREAAFGSAESTERANDMLRQMRIAAEEVKNEVIGLGASVETLNTALSGDAGGSGSGGAAGALNVAAASTRTFGSQIPGITTGVTLFASAQDALATSTERAAAAQERHNSALGQARGLFGALSSFAGAVGLAIPGGNIVSGLFAGISQLQSLSAPAPTPAALRAAPVVVNINGPGMDQLVSTVTVEQGRAFTHRRVARI